MAFDLIPGRVGRMVVLQDVGLGVLAEPLAQSKKACSQKELLELPGPQR